MSLKINFYPLHYILSLLALLAGVIVFNDTIYHYLSENIYLNGAIILLFILCTVWYLGVLSYYDRSARVLNKLLVIINPSMSKVSNNSINKLRRQSLYVASSINGTLFDTPIFSRAIVSSIRSGKLDISLSDTDMVIIAVEDNGGRVLGLTRFLTSIFVTLGLLGTFVGLLKTIDGVGIALGSLSNAQNVDILGFVKLLSTPLSGMGMAFSAALFGIASAIFGSYGNYVCTQKLSVFVHKLRNFLTASSALALGDPNKIDAKDILISLEDSFNRLYMGLAERLDVVADGVLGMSKAVLRTQEKQEKILKVVLDNFAAMEGMWERFIKSTEPFRKLNTLASDFHLLLTKNREELIKYVQRDVYPLLSSIVTNTDRTAKISKVALDSTSNIEEFAKNSLRVLVGLNEASEKILNTSTERNALTKEGLVKSDLANNILKDIASLNNINNEVSKDIANLNNTNNEVVKDIAGLNNLSNGLSNAILKTSGEGVIVSRDIRGVLSDSLIEHTRANSLSEEMIASSNEGNGLSNAILTEATTGNGLLNTILGEVGNGNGLSNAILGEINNGNGLSNAILTEATTGNGLLNTILGEVGNGNGLSNAILTEATTGNGLLNTILGEVGNGNGLSNAILTEATTGNGLLNTILGEVGNGNGLSNAILNEISNGNGLSNAILTEATTGNGLLNTILGEVGNGNGLSNAVLNEIGTSNALLNQAVGEMGNANAISDAILGGVNTSNELANALLNEAGTSNALLNQAVGEMGNANAISDAILGGVNTSNELANALLNEAGTSNALLNQAVSEINSGNEATVAVYSGIENLSSLLSSSVEMLGSTLQSILESSQNNGSQLYDLVAANYQSLEAVNYMTGVVEETYSSVQMSTEAMLAVHAIVEVAMGEFSNMSRSVNNNMEILKSSFEEFGFRFIDVVSNLENSVGVISRATDVGMQLDQTVYQLNGLLDALIPNVIDLIDSTNRQVESVNYYMDNVSMIVESTGATASYLDNLITNMDSNAEALLSTMNEYNALAVDNYMDMANSLHNITGYLDKFDGQNFNVLNGMENLAYEFANLKTDFESQVRVVVGDMSTVLNDILDTFSFVSDNMRNIGGLVDRVDEFLMKSEISQMESFNSIRDDLYSISDNQREFLNILEDNLADISSNVSIATNELVDKLEELQHLSDIQTDKLVKVEANINDFANSGIDFVGEASAQYQALQDVIMDLSGSFGVVTEALNQAANNIDSQTEMMERQTEIMENNLDSSNAVVEAVNNFTSVNQDLMSVAESIKTTSDIIMNFEDTLLRLEDSLIRLEDVTAMQDNAYRNLASNLIEDVNLLSDIVNSLNTAVSGFAFDKFYQEIVDLNNNIDSFINSWSDLSNDNSSRFAEMLGDMGRDIVDIRNTLLDNLSQDTMATLTTLAENNSELLERIGRVMPTIEDVMKSIANNDFDQRNDSILRALDSLKTEYNSGNVRLEVIANAIDSLITEMLNSRDVTQSILDMVAQINGYRESNS